MASDLKTYGHRPIILGTLRSFAFDFYGSNAAASEGLVVEDPNNGPGSLAISWTVMTYLHHVELLVVLVRFIDLLL